MERKYKTKVECHLHTDKSLLDGMIRPKALAKKLASQGEPGAFLTDHGNMYNTVQFYKAMRSEGLKPGIGLEAYCRSIDGERDMNHLILLAENNAGLRNLFILISEAQDDMYRGRPMVDYNLLRMYSEGIICTSACISGEIPRCLRNGNRSKAKEVAEELISIFGESNFYIEIQNHHFEEEDIAREELVSLAREMDIPLIATSDAHFLNKEDAYEHEVVMCIGTGKTMTDPSRMQFSGDGYHIATVEDFEERFSDYPDAIDNTVELLDRCNVELDFGSMHLPQFDVPEGHTEASYLRHITEDGFRKRFEGTEKFSSKEYRDRLDMELGVIDSMGYNAYFLIVWDFVRFAKENDVEVGPGRGSAAGSLVAYCLQITDKMDPIEYGLIFERFLNPERVSMPDIDIDFQDTRRHVVIEYVAEKYGADKVSQIVTFGTLGAKSAVRDVARALDLPYSAGDKIAKMIPDKPGVTLADAFEESMDLKALYEEDEMSKKILDIAKKIEGNSRHTSKHAAGILITPKAVENYVPMVKVVDKDSKEEFVVSQFNMVELEELGLLKMDFLGLKALSTIKNTRISVSERHPRIPVSFEEDIHDPYVYAFISEGRTHGVFQLESSGMMELMRELFGDASDLIKKVEKKYSLDRRHLHPEFDLVVSGVDEKVYEGFVKEMAVLGKEFFERLIAGISLYRPGPMSSIPTLLKNMKDPSGIEYVADQLSSLLDVTYGVLVYQEQVMSIVRELAGYSNSRSDLVRRAMGKKKMSVMEAERSVFIYGEVKCPHCNNGIASDGSKCPVCDGKGVVATKKKCHCVVDGQADHSCKYCKGSGVIESEGEYTVDGCLKRGVSESAANVIYDDMIDFAKYAFNKSHAAAYAVVAATTAYLKHYYPKEFMAETMNGNIGKADKLKYFLSIVKREGIAVLPPNINKSFSGFVVEGNAIRFGLKGIKNVGKASDLIMKARGRQGDFDTYEGFLKRMGEGDGAINRKALESLIYSGGLDLFRGTRRGKIEALELATGYMSRCRGEFGSHQVSLFDLHEDLKQYDQLIIPDLEEFDDEKKIDKELEYAGLYISGHPLDKYAELIEKRGYVKLAEVEEKGLSELPKKMTLIGVLKEVTIMYTRNQDAYARFSLVDETGILNCIMWPDKFAASEREIRNDEVVILVGRIDDGAFGKQLIVESAVLGSTLQEALKPKGLEVSIYSEEQIMGLKDLFVKKDGIPVFVDIKSKILAEKFGMKRFKARGMVTSNLNEISYRIIELFGNEYKVIYDV